MDLRRLALLKLHDRRNEPPTDSLTPAELGLPDDRREALDHVLTSLLADGLIRGTAIRTAHGPTVYRPEITGPGSSSLALPSPRSQTINVSGGNNQFGDGNTQHVSVEVHLQAIIETILGADMPRETKRSLLQHLHAVVSDGAVGNAAGVVSLIVDALQGLGGAGG
ncbi:hypothetical protein [Rubrivirga sp. IMCC43871]|uniref:hypothetical protein n=1 Tax=Rubrivirga sp. IMCC43871 TaxID=3391575 RepID=UPI0039901C61